MDPIAADLDPPPAQKVPGFDTAAPSFALGKLAQMLSQVGILVGALIGYFGGKLDILGQRAIEIWSSLPFLYTIIIVSSIIVPIYIPGRNLVAQPSFWLLIVILAIFDWIGITYYARGEFYREKAKDYVAAAISMGVSEPAIIFKHILPNALTPVVSFAPFAIVANIEALVAQLTLPLHREDGRAADDEKLLEFLQLQDSFEWNGAVPAHLKAYD